jgi:hypothetical protein
MAQFMPHGAIRVVLNGFFAVIDLELSRILQKPAGLRAAGPKVIPLTFTPRVPSPYSRVRKNGGEVHNERK